VLQPLGVERHADTVVPKDFQQIPARAAEHIEITCMWISPQRLLHLQRQAVHAAPHIGAPNR
jgi:hypothetical protein